jgi:chromosome segregation ATPase
VPFTDEEIQQYTREFAQRLAEARQLQERLSQAGQEVPELEEAIEAFESLQDPRVYGDLPQIAMLQEQIRENLKRVEFMLRREVEGESAGRAALSGTDDVPAGFRKMVEEYFKNLARGGGGGSGGGRDPS